MKIARLSPVAFSHRNSAFSLVEVVVCIGIITILMALTIPAIQRVREAANSLVCKSNLRQLGLALQGYHNDHKCLPPGCSNSGPTEMYPTASWCLRITPYLERDDIWENAILAFRSEKFFEIIPPHTGAIAVVRSLNCPSEPRVFRSASPRIAFTHYLGVSGVNHVVKDGLFYLNSKTRFADIHDGLSNTIAVGERPPSDDEAWGFWYAGWGQNKDGSADMVLGVRELNSYGDPHSWPCPTGPFEFGPGANDPCSFFHFWSQHVGGAHFLFSDGSVRLLRYDIGRVLAALATRNGREVNSRFEE